MIDYDTITEPITGLWLQENQLTRASKMSQKHLEILDTNFQWDKRDWFRNLETVTSHH